MINCPPATSRKPHDNSTINPEVGARFRQAVTSLWRSARMKRWITTLLAILLSGCAAIDSGSPPLETTIDYQTRSGELHVSAVVKNSGRDTIVFADNPYFYDFAVRALDPSDQEAITEVYVEYEYEKIDPKHFVSVSPGDELTFRDTFFLERTSDGFFEIGQSPVYGSRNFIRTFKRDFVLEFNYHPNRKQIPTIVALRHANQFAGRFSTKRVISLEKNRTTTKPNKRD